MTSILSYLNPLNLITAPIRRCRKSKPDQTMEKADEAAQSVLQNPHALEVHIEKSRLQDRHFSKEIIIGRDRYTVTATLPDNPEFNTDNYIEEVLVPQLTMAIQVATENPAIKDAAKFDLEFSQEGLSATPYKMTNPATPQPSDGAAATQNSSHFIRDESKKVPFNDDRTRMFSINFIVSVEQPDQYKKFIKQQKEQQQQQIKPTQETNQTNSASNSKPTSFPTQLLTPQNSPLPFINNRGNNCFLSTMVWTLLLNNPYMLEKLETAQPRPAQAGKNAQAERQRVEKETQALQILSQFVGRCATSIGKNSLNGIDELRTVLHLLSPNSFPKEDQRQRDVHEAWTLISDLILGNSEDNHLQTDMNFANGTSRKGAKESSSGRISIQFQPGHNLNTLVANHLWPDENNPIRDAVGGQKILSEKTKWKTAPRQLEIQLKRFDEKGNKIKGNVDVPLQMELLGDHFENGLPVKYQLYGTVLHHGDTINRGHFTALARVPMADGMHDIWADDKNGTLNSGNTGEMVEITDQNYLELAQQGYIFLYQKVDPKIGLIPSANQFIAGSNLNPPKKQPPTHSSGNPENGKKRFPSRINKSPRDSELLNRYRKKLQPNNDTSRRIDPKRVLRKSKQK